MTILRSPVSFKTANVISRSSSVSLAVLFNIYCAGSCSSCVAKAELERETGPALPPDRTVSLSLNPPPWTLSLNHYRPSSGVLRQYLFVCVSVGGGGLGLRVPCRA